MAAYNELLTEQYAVLNATAPASIASTTLALYTGSSGVNVANMRRVVLDINAGAGAGTFLFSTVTCCNTANATAGAYVDCSSAVTNSPFPAALYTGGSATLGGAAGIWRFEFSSEFLRQMIESPTSGAAGPWLRFVITTSGTAILGAVWYGVARSYPSADININKFALATAGACPVAQCYVDGVVGSTPANATTTSKLILPS